MADLIYDQNEIPDDRWRYGFRSSSAVGCGWIAIYNALELMHYHARPEELIDSLEKQLPLIHGNLGTMIWAPVRMFRQWGFPVTVTARMQEFDSLAENSQVSILFYHWRKGLRFGAHFVAVEKAGGQFRGYNTFRGSSGPDLYGKSLEAFVRRRGYFGCVLMGIRDKR